MSFLLEQDGARATAKFLRGAASRASNPRVALVDLGEALITEHAQRVSRGIDVHGRPFKPARRGGQTLFKTGEMASSTDYRATKLDLDFYSTDIRARAHNEGLLLRPTGGKKFLTIPLRSTSGESSQRFLGLRLRGGKSRTGARIRHYKGVFFRWSRGRLFAMQRSGEGKSGKLRALFLLVREQQMVKREWFGVSASMREYASKSLGNHIVGEATPGKGRTR